MNTSSKPLAPSSASIADLIEAVIANDTEKVQECLDNGADPNGYEDKAEVRPLHFAAQHNSLGSALLLIKAGADLSAETIDGLTPIDIAKINYNEDMMRVLLSDDEAAQH